LHLAQAKHALRSGFVITCLSDLLANGFVLVHDFGSGNGDEAGCREVRYGKRLLTP
jgi:hypothetical protein